MTDNGLRLFPQGAVNPDALLEAAKNADLESVVILGWDANGDLYFGSSCSKLREISWLMENGQVELRDHIRRGG